MLSEQVYHPDHYNLPGRKECIVEMEEKFGVKETFHFELLNAYKYIYTGLARKQALKKILRRLRIISRWLLSLSRNIL